LRQANARLYPLVVKYRKYKQIYNHHGVSARNHKKHRRFAPPFALETSLPSNAGAVVYWDRTNGRGLVAMSQPVAIIIPAHNDARTLARTLEDLRQQDFQDFSVTVAENALTDDTIKIVKAFCSMDARFQLDIGTEFLPPLEHCARAVRIGAAKGQSFVLRACDDTAKPDYLKKLVVAVTADPSMLIAAGHTRMVRPDRRGRFTRPAANAFGFLDQYGSGRLPRNLTFPAEWIYGLFRAEAAERLLKTLDRIGNTVVFRVLRCFRLRGS
jgi:glycosyltransferase involved in cell wall biosynthesis